MIHTVLFDLDGTLLPFNADEFMEVYFSKIAEKAAENHYEPKATVAAVWQGTKAMMVNDGTQTNRDAFWQKFTEIMGKESEKLEPVFNKFYENEFNDVKKVLKRDFNAKAMIDSLKAKGYTVVLATNPLFPMVAQKSRLSWIGLTPEDFALITSYETSCACKPSPIYFKDILSKIGKNPEECIMVGNDTVEDLAAGKLGVKCFLISEFMENKHNVDISNIPQGSFDDFIEYLGEI